MAMVGPLIKKQFLDTNGQPLALGKLYSYLAGTSTPEATLTDATSGVPNANPLILDSNGIGEYWLDPAISYKFVLHDANDVPQYTDDNISLLPAGSISSTALANNSVTDAKLRQSAGLSVIGRATNTTGNVADITAATDGHVLRRSGSGVGFGTVVAGGLASDSVTTGKILDSNVTTAKIADSNVTLVKLATDAKAERFA